MQLIVPKLCMYIYTYIYTYMYIYIYTFKDIIMLPTAFYLPLIMLEAGLVSPLMSLTALLSWIWALFPRWNNRTFGNWHCGNLLRCSLILSLVGTCSGPESKHRGCVRTLERGRYERLIRSVFDPEGVSSSKCGKVTVCDEKERGILRFICLFLSTSASVRLILHQYFVWP